MPTLELTEQQVIELVQQLPSGRKEAVLFALAKEATATREARMEYAESQLRQTCAERGLNWNTMSEEERENFVDDLIHEDRPCAQ